MIRLQINGKEVVLDGPTPLSAYLAGLGVDPRGVAVEINERILERSELAGTVLVDGDVVEIVRMVGGGAARVSSYSGEEMTDKEKAAEEQVDDDRLLPGEKPDSAHPEDALHWAEVYRELCDFKERAIEQITIDVIALGEEARKEIEGTDLVVLRAERDRFRRRAEFWRQRFRRLREPA